jgi:hypothetical protein
MKRIAYSVIALHLFVIFWSLLWMPSKKKRPQPLQVRTVVQAKPPPVQPPKPIQKPVVAAVKTEVKAKQPIFKPPTPVKPKPKKPPPPKIVRPKPTPKKIIQPVRSPPQKSKPVISPDLVKQLQQSIAKIDQKSHKESPNDILPTPKWIPKLKIDEEFEGEESLFIATLIQCLQNTLDLPEFGEVKVELVLKCDGSFIKMKVLQSESERNKKFLEQELKTVSFPEFNGNLKNEKEHAFTITFCNH